MISIQEHIVEQQASRHIFIKARLELDIEDLFFALVPNTEGFVSAQGGTNEFNIDGRLVDGLDVPVIESTERWTEIKLEDGSVLRVKPSVLSAIRIPDQWDPEGNPMYALKAANAMIVAEAPEHLKRPTTARKIQ